MEELDVQKEEATTTPVIEVDLDKVIRDKNPKMYRMMPRFIRSWLKRIIHQDQVNYILRNFSDLPPVEFARAALAYMKISYQAIGLDLVPKDGRYFFVSNHPFGGLDGLMLVVTLNDNFGTTKVIVNDLLMHLKPLAPIFIPVNKYGPQKVDYALMFRNELMSREYQIASFPAGICSRRNNKVVCDKAWRPSFVKNAIEGERDVVPIFFEGKLSNFFYNLSATRTKLGINTNLETLYLVDEMFKQSGSNFNIVFGEPIPWQTLAQEGCTPAEWADRIRRQVYELQKQIPENNKMLKKDG